MGKEECLNDLFDRFYNKGDSSGLRQAIGLYPDCVTWRHRKTGFGFIHLAAFYHLHDDIGMLQDAGAPIDFTCRSESRTACHWIAHSCSDIKKTCETMAFLKSRGADVNAGDRNLLTPLHIALNGGANIPEFKILAAAMVTLGARFDLEDVEGNTVLGILSQPNSNIAVDTGRKEILALIEEQRVMYSLAVQGQGVCSKTAIPSKLTLRRP